MCLKYHFSRSWFQNTDFWIFLKPPLTKYGYLSYGRGKHIGNFIMMRRYDWNFHFITEN